MGVFVTFLQNPLPPVLFIFITDCLRDKIAPPLLFIHSANGQPYKEVDVSSVSPSSERSPSL